MPVRPLVLLALCCAATAVVATAVVDAGPASSGATVPVARTGPPEQPASAGDVVGAPWVVRPAVRPLLPAVDALLVRDPAAGPPALVAERTASVTAAARSAGRSLRTVTAPAPGLPGLQQAVRAAGPPRGGSQVVLWLPGPAEQQPDCAAPGDPVGQAVAADLVRVGARLLPVQETPARATSPCPSSSSAAARVAAATGGAAVSPAEMATSALSAATVQLRVEPVCEPGLEAFLPTERSTALSGTAAAGRWEVRVTPDASAGDVLSCVLLPHVDGAPALDAVHALAVRVTADARSGDRPDEADESDGPAGALLEDVGEQLLDVRRLRDQLGDASSRLLRARSAEPDERVAALGAVLDALADREGELEERRRELAGPAASAHPAPQPSGIVPPHLRDPASRPPVGAGSPAGLASAESAREAVAYALAQLGEPYVWGATGPSTFDCSGLTSTAYASAGVRIPRVSRDQFWAGTPVAREHLLPGDLVFFARNPADPRTVHHVAMSLGEGQMVHAPQTGDVVRVVPLRTRGWAGAVRIVGAVAAPPGEVAITLPTVAPRTSSPHGDLVRQRRGPVLPHVAVPPAAGRGRTTPPRVAVPPRVPVGPGATPVEPEQQPGPGAQDPLEPPGSGAGPGDGSGTPPRGGDGRPPVSRPLRELPPVVVRPPRDLPPVQRPPALERPPVVVRPPVLERPPVVVRPPVTVRPPVIAPPPVVVRPPVLERPPVVVPPPVLVRPPVVQPPVVELPAVVQRPPLVVAPPVVVQPPPTVVLPPVRVEPPTVRLPVAPALPQVEPVGPVVRP